MEQQDYATAQKYMNVICKTVKNPTQRRWTKDEEEFLMHHVNSLGLEKACEVVGKKLNRNKSAVRAKYYKILREEKRS